MSCSGCSGAVERVLAKDNRIVSSKVDLASQTVNVTVPSTISKDEVQSVIAKSGKSVTPL